MDPDLELRDGEGGGGRSGCCFDLLALLAFLLSVISFFTENRGWGGGGGCPRSANAENPGQQHLMQ